MSWKKAERSPPKHWRWRTEAVKNLKNVMGLEKFLVRAKSATYASKGDDNEKKLDDGSTELTYEEGKLRYRDRYFGEYSFIGEEVAWKDDVPLWVMNYYGNQFTKEIPQKEFVSFLRKSMRQVGEDRPFRGPREFVEGDFRYTDESEGGVKSFKGIEMIYYKNKEIYRLYYHGGIVE